MLIIGIMGRKGSGKDTFFSHLALSAGTKTIRRLAFADPLKEEVSKAMGVPVEWIEERKNQWWMRTILQIWGTEFRREHFGEHYWIDKMRQQIKRVSLSSDIVVLTDVRFKNEADFVINNGGVLIRVVRPKTLWQRFTDLFKRHHASEVSVDSVPAHVTVANDCMEDGQTSLAIRAMAAVGELKRLRYWPE